MCTTIGYLDPASEWPVLIMSTRDEVDNRPTTQPGFHWQSSGLFGCKDELAGGSWLLLNTSKSRISIILNRQEIASTQHSFRSRGQYLLDRASLNTVNATHLVKYQPFNMLALDLSNQSWTKWDGSKESTTCVGEGLFMINSKDLNQGDSNPRIQRWFPIFEKNNFPSGSVTQHAEGFWEPWTEMLDAKYSTYNHIDSLNVLGFNHLPNYRTVNCTFVAIRSSGQIRYDYLDIKKGGSPNKWHSHLFGKT